MLKKRLVPLCLFLLLALLLTGCARGGKPETADTSADTSPVDADANILRIGGQEIPLDSAEITAVLAPGETELLSLLPGLRYADLSGSEAIDEIAAWAAEHPNVSVHYTIPLPDGRTLPSDTASYDLSDATAAEALSVAPALAQLPQLRSVNLGAERAAMGWDGIRQLRQILPETEFQYRFDLYGTECDLSAASVNLYSVPVYSYDDGEFIDEVMNYMPQLRYVDMDSVGLSMRRLEEINLNHPDVKVVFRVFFGDNYTARTDAERILASMASRGGLLTDDNVEGLYYCHDVKYLDIGHNTPLTDIRFAAQMPKLEVAIFSMCNISDISALADCPELEYLELSNTYVTDLRPLSGLEKLRHLNVAATGFDQPEDGSPRIRLTDITPLYPLTGLERLWIGAFNPVPPEQVEEMQRRAPNCEINVEVYEDPVGGHWRYLALADYIETYVDTYHDRYIKLREQFGNYEYSAYNFTWNDPLCPQG